MLSVTGITLGSSTRCNSLSHLHSPGVLQLGRCLMLPAWRPECYACPPNGAKVWTTSYIPGSNLAMANAS